MTTVRDIITKIEKFAPLQLAEDWDPIGLSIGDQLQPVRKMMVALDLDANTLKEAQEKEVDFIFTHHPAIFSALKTLNEEDRRRKQYIDLIRSDISLYSAHTNVDAAENGMNDWLAEAIGLKKPYGLMELSYEDSFKSLRVNGKTAELTQIVYRLAEINDGELQNYNLWMYDITRQRSTSAIESASWNGKIEVILPDYLVSKVVADLYAMNPKQTPDFYLTTIEKPGKSYGMGRVGSLKKKITIADLVDRVKKAYSTPIVRIANIDFTKEVQRIAILGGSGEKYYKQAIAKDADLYITGDISYHGAQDMIREGLAFIDPGHFIENIFVEKMTEKLKEWNTRENWEIEIIPSITQQDVFKFK